MPLAASLDALGSKREAIELLKPFWRGDVEDPIQLRVADLLLHIYTRLEKDDYVREVIATLEKRAEDDPRCLRPLGHYALRKGKSEEAIALFRKATEHPESAGDLTRLELADALRSVGRPDEAVAIYRDLVDSSRHTPLTERYLITLYEAKAYKEAYELAVALRGDGPAIPVVTEVEVSILEYLGDLETATSLLLELADLTKDPRQILNAVFLELRQDHRARADELLGSVSTADLKSPELMMQCAQAKTALGHAGALELAYEARRRAFGDPEVHLAYIWLFLNREKAEEEALNPDRMAVDTAAKLSRDGDEKVFVVLDDPDVSLERGELSPQDDLAQKLLGKRAGEHVLLKESGLEDLSYEVLEVQSKYVAAFQHTLLNFTTWWPTHPALQKLEFKDNDFTKIFGALDAREKFLSQVMHAYREKGLPLGTIALSTGSSTLDVWRSLVGLRDQVLFVASGRSDDLSDERELVANSKEILVELSAVLTIALLDLGDTLLGAFDRVLIAQATRDEVLADYSKQFEGAVPSSVMGKYEGKYFAHEITEEEREASQSFLQRLRDFLTSCETVPSRAALDLGHAEAARIEELVGSSAANSVLAAQSSGFRMWIDDLPLKNLAKTEWKVEVFSVQPILQVLRDKGVLDSTQYVRCIRELSLANYFHISVGAEDIWSMLEVDSFEISPAWTTVVHKSIGPSSDLGPSAGVAADLLRTAWLSGLPEARKMLLLDAVLTAVVGHRPNRTASAAALESAVRQAFALLPMYLDPILRSIAIWAWH